MPQNPPSKLTATPLDRQISVFSDETQSHACVTQTTQSESEPGGPVSCLKTPRSHHNLRNMAEDVVHHSLERCTTIFEAEGRIVKHK